MSPIGPSNTPSDFFYNIRDGAPSSPRNWEAKMGQQLLGSVETAHGPAHAMLCIDDDQPDEFMIHLWGPTVASSAILLSAVRDGKFAHLTPTVVFRASDTGNIYMPSYADLTAEELLFKEKVRATLVENGREGYTGDWTDPHGVTRKASFEVISDRTDAKLDLTRCTKWADFKSWADQARTLNNCTAFRGHGSDEFRLETTLSRVGRTRVDRYCNVELLQFNALLEASMNMRFDLTKKDDYATVLGLAQHHGLPTPLLDWTSSPYVAAFFALSDAIEMAQGRPSVKFARVFGLTQTFISQCSPPAVTVSALQPYLCSLVISPMHNPRLLAQQGRFLVTNLSNVEAFIQLKENQDQQTYLHAVDIPISEASQALEDLAFMGLTAATMFPGLDGLGKMIRHQMLFKTAKVTQKQ